jgi:hypothetical protein
MKQIPYVEDAELSVMTHALGIEKQRRTWSPGGHRNHYNPSLEDKYICERLSRMGFMELMPKLSWVPDELYRVTRAGIAAMILAGFKIRGEQ